MVCIGRAIYNFISLLNFISSVQQGMSNTYHVCDAADAKGPLPLALWSVLRLLWDECRWARPSGQKPQEREGAKDISVSAHEPGFLSLRRNKQLGLPRPLIMMVSQVFCVPGT